MNHFFYLKKKCFILKILIFFVFDKSTNFKMNDVSQTLLSSRSYNFNCFFAILGNIKLKFGQKLVQFRTKIST